MKIISSKYMNNYKFSLTFISKETMEVDLFPPFGSYLNQDNLNTMNVNLEWGYLEFLEGKVNIEPKTLYKYAKNQSPLFKIDPLE
jgi:hypothetical protein